MSIRHRRLQNQHLTGPKLNDPVDVLRSLVAIQGQDYYGAKWALAQRTTGCTDAHVEEAFSDGRILRLHVMRPTWHFVAPEDLRWLVKLTAPRVNVASTHAFRVAELDPPTLKKTNKAIAKALQGGKHLTRAELRDVIKRAGVEPGNSMRLGYIMIRAELDLIVCSGARKGAQFTYALVDERVPNSTIRDSDDALGKLATRYFTTRGPATLSDFVWWSGLTMAQAKRGVEIAGADLRSEVMDERTLFSISQQQRVSTAKKVHLLPAFDEYFIAYRDRTAGMHPELTQQVTSTRLIYSAPLVIDGLVVGGWKRVLKGDLVCVAIKPFRSFNGSERAAVSSAAEKFAEFLQCDLRIDWK